MSARIAPEPINGGSGAVADYRSRTVRGDSQSRAGRQAPEDEPDTLVEEQAPDLRGRLPVAAPPPPSGAAFAAALITGQLPPRPVSEREIQLQLGSADLPAQGSLALHDRLV